ncbi:MAG TPA: hypothetical protein VJR29_05345 [bacterium]|nr:hypothetical protein [bacterium]
MGLGDLFRRLSKGAGSEPKAPAGTGRPGRTKGGKVLPPIPTYLKKDKFLRDAEAAAAAVLPPEEVDNEVAETSSFKKPGAWLKSRLGGVSDSKAPKNIEKTTKALRRTGNFNDEEIATFLSGLLDVAGVEEENPSPGPPPSGS